MKYNFDPFSVEYDKIENRVFSFKDECIISVQNALRKNKKQLPIVVMMSGGIDSELVAESVRLSGNPFKCVIGRLLTEVNGERIIFNSHDFVFAENWCKKNSIEVLYCDIDIYKQCSLLAEYALSASSFSPQYACHMYLMKWCSDNGMFFLAGNGEMDIVLRDNNYYMMDEQREMALGEFCKINNLSGEFQFWKQDGRIISSFLKFPTVKRLMASGVERLLDFKHQCFSDEFVFDYRKKQTGFELIQEWDYHLRTYLKKFNGKFDEKYYTPISHF
jgi:hypothetical protein